MVRPKTTRNGAKRGYTSVDSNIQLSLKLRDFDVNAECLLANIELKYRNENDKLESAFDSLRTRIPKKLLLMTMAEIREYSEDTEKQEMSIAGNQTMMSNMSTVLEKSCRKKSKDDGYLTEESDIGESRVSALGTTRKRLGPLLSAKYKRRSKSADPLRTPSADRGLFGQNAPNGSLLGKSCLSGIKPMPDRASRSKYKTPLLNNRPKAASADRTYGTIQPKVLPNAALAMIRHAKHGESVFAVTGSPVITANIIEATANVNIPVSNGMISIRPAELETVDVSLVRKIEPHILNELKQLQVNLDKIMKTLKL